MAILGLGKAGGSLAASLARAHVEVCASARRARGLRRSPGLVRAAALFLAVPDRVIGDVASELSEWATLPPLVAHLSGARGLDALAPLALSARVASFHPLASLDGASPIPEGTLIAWDVAAGAANAGVDVARARKLLTTLARRVGGVAVHIGDAQRARYHAGAVVAGNLPVALLHLGIRLLVDAGVPERTARVSLARLLRSQAENAAARPLPRALSGPAARGDAQTIARHVAVLDAETREVYRLLTQILAADVAELEPGARAAILDALRR